MANLKGKTLNFGFILRTATCCLAGVFLLACSDGPSKTKIKPADRNGTAVNQNDALGKTTTEGKCLDLPLLVKALATRDQHLVAAHLADFKLGQLEGAGGFSWLEDEKAEARMLFGSEKAREQFKPYIAQMKAKEWVMGSELLMASEQKNCEAVTFTKVVNGKTSSETFRVVSASLNRLEIETGNGDFERRIYERIKRGSAEAIRIEVILPVGQLNDCGAEREMVVSETHEFNWGRGLSEGLALNTHWVKLLVNHTKESTELARALEGRNERGMRTHKRIESILQVPITAYSYAIQQLSKGDVELLECK